MSTSKIKEKNSEQNSNKLGTFSWLKESILKSSAWIPAREPASSIRLDLNENQFVSIDKVNDVIHSLDDLHVNQYPRYETLYEALSHESGISSDQLLATNGAAQAIEIVIRSLSRERNIVLAAPEFSYYQYVLNLEGLKSIKIWCNKELNIDTEALLSNITLETGAVLLMSPSNPLSTEIQSDDLERLLQKAISVGSLVVVDEVYAKFTGRDFGALVSLYPNLVLIRSFSKYHGLASLRLGYLASDAKNILQFSKIRGPWDISGLTAQIVISIIHSKTWFDFLGQLSINRRKIIRGLKACGAHVIVASEVNFVTFFHPAADELVLWLKKNGVIVAPMTSSYLGSEGLLNNCIRMSVPNCKQISTVLQLLREFEA